MKKRTVVHETDWSQKKPDSEEMHKRRSVMPSAMESRRVKLQLLIPAFLGHVGRGAQATSKEKSVVMKGVIESHK